MTHSSPTSADADRPVRPGKVVLIGMMGAGKSVAGRLVAGRLGWPWVDSDEQVQRERGRTVAQIFSEEGEPVFRAAEAQVLAEAMTGEGPLVLSVAGGAVLMAANRRVLRRGEVIVWLRADLATLARRVLGAEHRPLLAADPPARLAVLYAERRPQYEALADVVIDVDTLTPSEVADRIVAAVEAHRAATVSSPAGAGHDD